MSKPRPIMSEEHITLLMYGLICCPDCGSNCAPDDCTEWTVASIWTCSLCDRQWNTRQLVEHNLQRGGLAFTTFVPVSAPAPQSMSPQDAGNRDE